MIIQHHNCSLHLKNNVSVKCFFIKESDKLEMNNEFQLKMLELKKNITNK